MIHSYYWVVVYKSAKTGEFVSEAYARKHPYTTYSTQVRKER